MLRLDFVKKPIEQQQKIVDDYYERILEHRDDKRIKRLNEWCETNLYPVLHKIRTSDNRYIFFEKVIKADYKDLKRIFLYLKEKNLTLPDDEARYMKKTMYERAIDKKLFANNLQVTVCPYCNRNFINSGVKTAGCQLDHFFNKSQYPILAASFYNLIPVCARCNNMKKDEEFVHSPFDPDISADDLLIFTYWPVTLEYLEKEDGIEIDIEYLHQKMAIDKDMEILEIKKLYQIHRDRVIELLKVIMIYDDIYLSQIVDQYTELFKDSHVLKQIIAGTYVEESNYIKRPLAKLLSDIGRQCGFF